MQKAVLRQPLHGENAGRRVISYNVDIQPFSCVCMFLTYRYRVKSKAGQLNTWARKVNFVWNFCNNTQKHARMWGKRWPTNVELDKLTSGSSKELRLPAATIQAISAQYVKSRDVKKKNGKNCSQLRYRGKRSLGWVPFKGQDLKRHGNAFRFAGHTFRVFDSRPLPEGKIKCGSSFSQDARGRWYLNIVIEISELPQRPLHRGVGIDLGLKDAVVLSTGEKIENSRHYRKNEEKLAIAQRANKKRQVKTIHVKITNTRRDEHHKLTTRLVNEYDYIAVGNVNSAGLAKTKFAKSVYDVSWSSIRGMLRYKSIAKGAWYEEVDEKFTTQTCSYCGALPDERPRGIAGLGIRQWTCSGCGTEHDRDVNAAQNIRMKHAVYAQKPLSVQDIERL